MSNLSTNQLPSETKNNKKLNSFSTDQLSCYDYVDEDGNECIEIPCDVEFEQDENGYYKLDYMNYNKNNKK